MGAQRRRTAAVHTWSCMHGRMQAPGNEVWGLGSREGAWPRRTLPHTGCCWLLQGRVACEINSGDELVATEMIFAGVLTELEPEEAVALLSALVFQARRALPMLAPATQCLLLRFPLHCQYLYIPVQCAYSASVQCCLKVY